MSSDVLALQAVKLRRNFVRGSSRRFREVHKVALIRSLHQEHSIELGLNLIGLSNALLLIDVYKAEISETPKMAER